MRLTTARYYTPSGRSIQATGIDPDILVEQAKVEKLGAENRPHESDLKGALTNGNSEEGAAPKAEPEVEQNAAAEPKTDEPKKEEAVPFVGSEREQIARPDDDFQLARAIDLLRGLALIQGKSAAN
jgi:carboxyl-terminal processing protease